MNDSLISKEDRKHLAKAELIEKLSPYYETHESSLYDKLSNMLNQYTLFFHMSTITL